MKGYGIFVGVNNTKDGRYETNHKFKGAKKNAEYMYSIASETQMYEPEGLHLLTDNDCTWEETKKHFQKYIKLSKEDDSPAYLLITFSGHGYNHATTITRLVSRVRRRIPATKYTQFLCFKDRMVPENEIRDLLAEFKNNFKVVLIIDSCYSGGINDEEILVPHKINKRWNRAHRETFRRAYIRHGAFYRNRVRKYPATNRWKDYEADICHFSSCRDYQKAKLGRINGMTNYTKAFKLIWEKGDGYCDSYRYLNYLLQEILPSRNEPIFKSNPHKRSYFFDNTVPIAFKRQLCQYNNSSWHIRSEETESKVSLEIDIPHKNYYLIGYLVRCNRADLDLKEVKKYLEGMAIKAEIIVILQLGVSEESLREETIRQQITEINTKIEGDNKDAVYIIYDFEHDKVKGHLISKNKLNCKL